MMKTFARPRLLVLALYIASAALVTVQQAILRHSNNVSIFRSASFNLFAGRDLYAAHPEQHFDFYKYSPTFAVLFAPVAYLRSEEHTSELQSLTNLVCRLLLEKKKKKKHHTL